jgi:prophage regulatory protein
MLRILRRAEVAALTGLSPTRIHELELAGAFPGRIRLSARACGWKSDEIEAWIAARPRAADVRPDIGGDPRRRGSGKPKATRADSAVGGVSQSDTKRTA